MIHRPGAIACLCLFVVTSCADQTPAPARIGEACATAADCLGKRCEHGLCTRDCIVQADCPEGFDCGLMDPSDVSALCYRARWSSPATGGYGTSCAASALDCGGANSCAEGFSCHAHLACDARAYCTKACAADADCPPDMFCGRHRDEPSLECLSRTACQPCGVDDQCPASHVCATFESGERYCARQCATLGDCRRPTKDGETDKLLGAPFELCLADPGGKGLVCTPVAGQCHGASQLPGEAATAGICAQCRSGHPDDCPEGTVCFADDSGERFCTAKCSLRIKSGVASEPSDDCPDGSFCFVGGDAALSGCGSSCVRQGLCAADPERRAATCFPLQ